LAHEHQAGAHIQAALYLRVRPLHPIPPVTYIVPSEVVANVLKKSHAEWLNIPGRLGQAHRDNDVRRLSSDYTYPVPGYPSGWLERYREPWGSIQAAAGAERKAG
jgi:hypothetical protein